MNAKSVSWYVVAWIVLTGLCLAFVDRAASSWSYVHLHAVRMTDFDWATHLVDPLEPLSLAALAVIGIRAMSSPWRPAGHWRTVLIGAVAVLVAVALKDELKYLFGRTWPETWTHNNPSWIGNGAYGFHFRHGGEGWGSFPSGHLTRSAAVGETLWLRAPKLRWLAILYPALVAIGLFGCDYHFVGDMVAGAFLGAGVALASARVLGANA